jgi:hypothetical protein
MPALRALDRPIAMACFVDRAPRLPSRIWSISSRTNSPACVLWDLPSPAWVLPSRSARPMLKHKHRAGLAHTVRFGAYLQEGKKLSFMSLLAPPMHQREEECPTRTCMQEFPIVTRTRRTPGASPTLNLPALRRNLLIPRAVVLPLLPSMSPNELLRNLLRLSTRRRGPLSRDPLPA